MAQYGVRIVIGKGGLGPASQAAFREHGGVYLAIIGGTAALETTWIEAIEDVDLDDLNPESLWRFRVRDFGPLRVAMDSHGAQPLRRGRRRGALAPRRGLGAARRGRDSVAMQRLRTDLLDPRRRRRGTVRRAACASRRSRAAGHHRRQGAARQMRLHAHGPGRLQRRARPGRLGRAPLHGHDRGRQVAPRPGSRLDAGQRRGGAHPRARERARLLLRPQPRRQRPSEGVRRADLRSHGAQGRPDRHRDHQPARRAGMVARHRAPRGAPRARLSSSTPTGDLAGVLLLDVQLGDYVFVQARAVLLATGGGPTMYKFHTPSGDKSCDGLAMALRAGCRCATWRWCSSTRPGCSPGRTRA